jgi:hypothetical protein
MDYTSNQSAQGLASLGRNNDSMLVHMTPREVGGLQQLAMAHGGSLTINPQTGLPEAGFLDSIIPLVGGAALSPFMGPMAAGLLVGGVTALASGDISKGLMAGLGGFGGADLAKTFGAMGASGGIPVGAGTDAVKAGIADSLPMGAAENISMFTPNGVAGAQSGILGGAQSSLGPLQAGANTPNLYQGAKSMFDTAGTQNQILGGIGPQTVAGGGGSSATTELAKSLGGTGNTYGEIGKGIGDFASDPLGQWDKFKQAGGTPMKLAGPAVGLALSGMEPEVPEPYVDPDKGKWRGPQGQLNLSDKWSTGLRLAAQGGEIKSYQLGGPVGNPSVGGGLADLYNRPEGQTMENISEDGYGIARLNNLASQESMQGARTLGYADGGGVVASDKGMNMNGLPTLNLNFVSKPADPILDKIQTDRNSPFGSMMGSAIRSTNNNPFGFVTSNTGNSSSPFMNMMALGGKDNSALAPAPTPKSYALNLISGKQEPQYAHGGYLNGQGDGMSDSIPATIEGKQPARLADGEFVVPADVVSHIGNGSSKAGSKRLYAMLDKVRQARTGTKKQGKEINPAKYMPA